MTAHRATLAPLFGAALACAALACARGGGGGGGGVTSGPSVPAACAPADPAPGTLFADEFDAPALDRAKWQVYLGPVYNDELQAYVDDTATIDIVHGAAAEGAACGALRIRAVHRPDSVADPVTAGRRAEFTSGRLHGRTAFHYGTVTARMKLPAGAGLWPAFWLLGTGPWPHTGEIDVMENVGDPTWVSVALHGPGYSGDTPLLARDTLPAGFDATAWHEYAVTWAADSILFRVDGRPIYLVRRADVARHGPPAALDSAKYVVLNLAVGGGYPATVNGVRAPRLGLPDATLEQIRRGEAVVLVDWVRAMEGAGRPE